MENTNEQTNVSSTDAAGRAVDIEKYNHVKTEKGAKNK